MSAEFQSAAGSYVPRQYHPVGFAPRTDPHVSRYGTATVSFDVHYGEVELIVSDRRVLICDDRGARDLTAALAQLFPSMAREVQR